MMEYTDNRSPLNEHQNKIKISKIFPEDLERVAHIHKKSYLKNHFSSRFPIPLLVQFYRELIDRNAYCLLAKKDGEIIGFIIAGANCGQAISIFMKRKRAQLMLVLLRNPKFLWEKIKQVWRSTLKRMKKNERGGTSKKRVGLLSIAIHPKYHRQGIANKMMLKLEELLNKNDIKTYGLSVKKDNHNAIALYEKMGFELEYETKSFHFVKELS